MRLPKRVLTMVGLIALIGSGAAVVGTTTAQAASYTYANLSAPQDKVYFSGNRASISGGHAELENFSAGGATPIAYLETYRPYPGYQRIAYNTGTGGEVNMLHGKVTNASQKCWWEWPWPGDNIGGLDFNCRSF